MALFPSRHTQRSKTRTGGKQPLAAFGASEPLGQGVGWSREREWMNTGVVLPETRLCLMKSISFRD